MKEAKVFQSIKVDNVDIDLLRQQRDFLLSVDDTGFTDSELLYYGGLLNLIDDMLDIAEGFDKC